MTPPRNKRQGYNNYNNNNNYNHNNYYMGAGAYDPYYVVVPSNHRPTHAVAAASSDSHSSVGRRPSIFSFVKTNKHGHVSWGVRHPAKLH